jgi:hypothetical protein
MITPCHENVERGLLPYYIGDDPTLESMKRFKWQKGLGKRKEKLINLSNHFCLIA